ncbi:MAG: 4-hydroxythreonine-4-phosphate dehydrogenase PdxA [Negativicutes bacterium]|nr:4-hydroxythreonine-4-phosphate dehydrogenase PdxA [Negativicutes bacterium]
MNTTRPIIGITLGDPSGIGPEIIAKSLAAGKVYDEVKPLVIGSGKILSRALAGLGLGAKVNAVTDPQAGKYEAGIIDVFNIDNIAPDVPYGQISAVNGTACYEYIKTAVKLALAGQLDGVATAPINKEAIHMAGIEYIGHTEMFAGLTGTTDVLTMFHVNKMRIFFLTRHISLAKAVAYIKHDNVLRTVEQCDTAMKHLGFANARIAVAALNPHGGDNGLCGDEEINELGPAVKSAVAKGINAFGPVPADSVFLLFESGKCDAVLSLYHDQGHIAAKVHDFLKTVSVTIGLPFIRTSVDHGTAMDIAGKGIASAVSMEESIQVTGQYALKLKNLKL